jgi:hypothetical protein
MRSLVPKLLAIALLALYAVAEDSPKKSQGKTQPVYKAKAADAWVEKFLKSKLPDNVPQWADIFASLEKKYGPSKVPCRVYDSAREQYFQEFIMPVVRKDGYDPYDSRINFMKATDLPTTRTITGRKRQGCVAD